MMHHFKKRQLFTSRQWRWFWESFFISLIFLLFVTAFLYLAYGRDSGIQEPLISASLSSSQPLSTDGKGHPFHDTDVLSISFFGLKKELSALKTSQLIDQLKQDYLRFRFFIPARFRTLGGGLYLLWKLSGI